MSAPPLRVAERTDDLRVGQWVAWSSSDEVWRTGKVREVSRLRFTTEQGVIVGLVALRHLGRPVIILSDPPPEPVTVSREAFDRLAEALSAHPDYTCDLLDPARALVDEVRGQE